MRISLSLLQSFFHNLDLPLSKLSETLTLLGIEVDGIEDQTLELSLTPNLGHCLSALGIARELAAALQRPLHLPKIALAEHGKSSIRDKIHVAVRDPALCPRYACRLIEGVRIGPSPLWLQQELLACGLKPVSNAVDGANYIMMKLGQPLHAFDSDRIEGARLEISPAKTAQKWIGLDDVEREIPSGALLVSDAHKILAIAGVIGGKNSAVSETTHNILLEAAFFDPAAIRSSAKKLGLRTESAIRFEKGVDPNNVLEALDEAAHLIATLCGGHIAQGAIDLKQGDFSAKEIRCRPARVNQLLGVRLSSSEIEECFHRLGWTTESLSPMNLKNRNLGTDSQETLRVRVPYFRFDIGEEIDLVEEVARIYGYNNIEKKASYCLPSSIPHDPIFLFEKEMRKRAVALGLQEALTADLISPFLADLSSEFAASHLSLLKAVHAKTEEYSILRPSLLPGLARVVQYNLDQKNTNLALFEIGRIHFIQEKLPVEIPMIAFILTGKGAPEHWSAKSKEVDYFHLKGLLETWLTSLKIPSFSFGPSQHLSFHPARQATISSGSLAIGSLGELHPDVAEKLDIKQRVYFAELHTPHLARLHKANIEMTPLPSFPSSERDWTVSLPLHYTIDSLIQEIRAAHSPLLESVDLIDLYYPESASQKNATLRFTYRDRIHTVSFQEVEAAHASILEAVAKLLAK